METKKPVALWKGIVGTAVSGFVILLAVCLFFPLYSVADEYQAWLIVWFIVAVIVCTISLVISLNNIKDAVAYKGRLNRQKKVVPPEENNEKTELLHRLLAEGKITIEEYDLLNK